MRLIELLGHGFEMTQYEYDFPHRRLKVYRGGYWDLKYYLPLTEPIPNVYAIHWHKTNRDEKALIICDEVAKVLTEEMEEFIMQRAVYLLNNARENKLLNLQDFLNADIYAMRMTNAKTSMLREIEEAYKKALDDKWGCIVRMWLMRGRKKYTRFREKYVREHRKLPYGNETTKTHDDIVEYYD